MHHESDPPLRAPTGKSLPPAHNRPLRSGPGAPAQTDCHRSLPVRRQILAHAPLTYLVGVSLAESGVKGARPGGRGPDSPAMSPCRNGHRPFAGISLLVRPMQGALRSLRVAWPWTPAISGRNRLPTKTAPTGGRG